MADVRGVGRPGFARRAAQVAVAVAVIVAVAVLARPPDVTVTPPFEVERGTPGPRPEVTETPPPPEPVRAGIRLGVVVADTDTLAPAGDRLELGPSHSYLASAMDPSGRWLAVATGSPDGTSRIRLVDVVRLGTPAADFPPPARFLPPPEPLGLVTVPATVERLRFAPTSGELVWLGRLEGAVGAALPARGVGVVRLDAEAGEAGVPLAVPLPGDFEPVDIGPLDDDRVGVFGYGLSPETGGEGDGRTLGAVRVLVADVRSGGVSADVTVVEGSGGSNAPLADVAWDTRRQRAYVADPGGAVTVVDLAAAARGAQVRVRDAPPGAPDAGATPARRDTGGRRDALLSPDGTRLYVSGTRPGRAFSGAGPSRPARLPLAVFDAVAEAQVEVERAPSGRVAAIAPGGDRLAVVTGLPGPEGPQSLVVLDAETLEERWRRPVDGVGLVEVAFAAAGERLVTVHPERAPGPAVRLTSFDAATGDVLASRAYDGLPVGMFPATGVLVLFGRG